jgi:hypothetical protein
LHRQAFLPAEQEIKMIRLSNSLLRKSLHAAGLAFSLAVAGPSFAIINYGDFSDIPPGTVTYTDVKESSSTDPVPPPLYGAPSINGNLLDFDPTAFGANAAGAGGFDITDGQLNFTMTAESGTSIDTLIVSEGGDYSFSGLVPDAGTFVVVSVATTVNILEVNGITLGVPIEIFQTDTFVSDYLTIGNPPASGLNLWSLDYSIDLASQVNGDVTKIEVVIDNQLSATTTDGNQAFIAKKDFNVNIPEPTSLALLGLGAAMTLRRRRDR